MLLKQEFIQKLKEDRTLKIRLAAALGVEPLTIENRIKKNSQKLTAPVVLKFLSESWSVNVKDLTETK